MLEEIEFGTKNNVDEGSDMRSPILLSTKDRSDTIVSIGHECHWYTWIGV